MSVIWDNDLKSSKVSPTDGSSSSSPLPHAPRLLSGSRPSGPSVHLFFCLIPEGLTSVCRDFCVFRGDCARRTGDKDDLYCHLPSL